jgi:GTPase
MTAEAGQTVSFALKRIKRQSVRKGMVIVKKTDEPPPRRMKYSLCPETSLMHGYTSNSSFRRPSANIIVCGMHHSLGCSS